MAWNAAHGALADRFTVLCTDLPGYGASGTPPSLPDHAPHSKRALARDLVRLMEVLGFTRFAVAGQDRGGRVAYRMALDHPGRIERAAVLDVIPTGEAFKRADARFAVAFWPWALLAQPEPLPERLISADPEAVVDDALRNWGSEPDCVPPAVRRAYVDALRNTATVHAVCEEYRAAAAIDVIHDEMDREAGRRILPPLLALWSRDGPLDRWYEDEGGPAGIWSRWASDLTTGAIAGGHFFPEQNPDETVATLRQLFDPGPEGRPG